MKKTAIIILALVACVLTCAAEEYTYKIIAEADTTIKTRAGGVTLYSRNVRRYVYEYPSKDVDGKPVTISGVIIIPSEIAKGTAPCDGIMLFKIYESIVNNDGVLRYINLDWKNPLLKAASFLRYESNPAEMPALPDGPMTPVTLRIMAGEEAVCFKLGNPEILQRSTDTKTKSVTIQVELPLSKELENLLLSLGTDIEVLAPENIRDDMRQSISSLQKLYKKETASSKKSVQGDLFEGLF